MSVNQENQKESREYFHDSNGIWRRFDGNVALLHTHYKHQTNDINFETTVPYPL